MLANFQSYTRIPPTILHEAFAGPGVSFDEWMGPADAQTQLQAARRLLGEERLGGVFDLEAALRIMQLERYVESAQSPERGGSSESFIRKAYYAVRPILPVPIRKHLQRAALRGWDRIPFPTWPVDFTGEQMVEAIWRTLLETAGGGEIPFIWFWPEGHSSCCIMTHDVETAAGRDFSATLMQMEERAGIRSAFEVVPEERYEVPEAYLDEIRLSGCEVCVHGLNHDGYLFSSRDLFLKCAEKINAYAQAWGATGFRSPVLYRNLAWLCDLQFAYDMSVPNVGHLDPQKGGCCTAMPYFIGDQVELPLTTIQDYSLYNILQSRSLDIWKLQIERIRAHHGLISFIIHPDYTTSQWAQDLYEALLDHLASLRSQLVWMALPGEVNAWWRARAAMKITRKGDGWIIEGAEAHRASLAYVSTVEGRLTFRREPSGLHAALTGRLTANR